MSLHTKLTRIFNYAPQPLYFSLSLWGLDTGADWLFEDSYGQPRLQPDTGAGRLQRNNYSKSSIEAVIVEEG